MFKLTFACISPISWPAISGALDNSSICCKKIQVFEKKGSPPGIVLLLVLSRASQDKPVRTKVESALKFAMKKTKTCFVKLPFGLCGCQEENSKKREHSMEMDVEIDEAVSRVLSMVDSPDTHQQYHCMLEKYRQAKAELASTRGEASLSTSDFHIMEYDDMYQFL
ncbi:hypothetical protein TanjilG_21830 [Lupinus angustifolius]|uniref:DUF7377 domain-containing protein n=1 Tax=Lupinus angustifolius TaxID=3871 RepID=A0A1J7GJF7_LUPAN|nr:hypothetical protein TanjilG_21830 [Lupinus angustifolius]